MRRYSVRNQPNESLMADENRARIDDRQDIAGLISRYKRHLPILLISILVMMGLAVVASKFMPKRYTATAQLIFAPQESVVKGTSTTTLTDLARDAEIEGQLQIVQSLPVAGDVVRSQRLMNDPDLVKDAKSYARTSSNPLQPIAAAALKNVSARRVGQTTLFNVSYTADDPLRAMNIANAFADAYLRHQLNDKLSTSGQTSSRLNQQLESLRKAVERADSAVAAFRVQHNLLNQPDSTVSEQEIAAVRSELSQAKADAAEAASRSTAVNQQTAIGSGVNGAINTSTLSQLQQQRAEVARRVAALSSRYGDKHPLIQDAQKEQAAIDAQISQEMQRLTRVANAASYVAATRAQSLESSLSAAQGRLAQNVDASVQLADLQRQAQSARDLYQNLLQTSGQQDAQRALVQPDSRLAAPATLPLKPSSPNVAINVFLGFVVGVAIGIAIAFARERWSQGLDTVDDIDRFLNQDYLNSIPTLNSAVDKPKTNDPAEAVLVHPLSAYTEAFRNLATSLVYAAKRKSGKLIGITSALPKEGKTTTSIAIARVLAAAGSRVLLIDTDLRRRSVTVALAPDATAGLVQVLHGEASLDEVLLTDPSGANILPLAAQAQLGEMPYEHPNFERLLGALRERYDVIIADTAPILAVTDTRIIMRHFDALLMLTRWRSTPVKAIRAALHQIETVGGEITGVALSMVNLKTQGEAGYGDASYYRGYMKDYYSTS